MKTTVAAGGLALILIACTLGLALATPTAGLGLTSPTDPAAAAGRWVLPLPAGSYQRTSGYGPRTLAGRTAHHYGVDWAAPAGTPIHAAAAGRVTAARCTSPTCARPGDLDMPGSGLVVVIDHGHRVATLYAHAIALAVTAGQPVTAGQLIGWVGSTGHSTGNHLHFQVHLHHPPIDHTTTVDPEAFLRAAGLHP
jgi:murein DD-endopeptidase MepM/ murein hydrolase activator NlpD